MSFCSYYDAKVCRSCAWLELPYEAQLQKKEEELHTLLDPFALKEWLETAPSQTTGFRNKAKMVALPSPKGVVLGLDAKTSLIDCPLYDASMQKVLHAVEKWLQDLAIQAYDVQKKKGELKFVLLTEALTTAR